MHLANISVLLLTILFASAQTVVTIRQGPTSSTAQPDWTSDDTFTSAVLNSTNSYRNQHNAPDVTWNGTLAGFAADYLDGMPGDSCDFEHSDGPYGENLAKGYPNATRSVEAWGDERDDYDFDRGQFDEETGHFTQLWYIVCEYWPRGNIVGQFVEQVQEEGFGERIKGPLECLLIISLLHLSR
ncbi:SCP-like extracellular protein [Colletotrichum somersetense]|nr:SCP-like extracellular protein [Colletotrichum somersetense]